MTETITPVWRGTKKTGSTELGNRRNGFMAATMETRMKRRIERRELRVYYALAFSVCLPVVALGRMTDLVRGRAEARRKSVLDETHSMVGAMLGFVFMA